MSSNVFKKAMACACSLALAGALVPATAVTAFADSSSDTVFYIATQDAVTGDTVTVKTYTEQELADITDNYPTLSYAYAKGVYSTSSYVEFDTLLDGIEEWTDGSYIQFTCSDGAYTKWTYTYEYATASKYFYPNDSYDGSSLVADPQSAYEVPDVLALNSQSSTYTTGSKLLDLIDVSEAESCSTFFTGVETDGSSNAGRLMPQEVEGITIIYQHELTSDDVTLSSTSYTYDGSAKTPTVTVAAADGTELAQSVTTEETDDDGNTVSTTTENYTVAYSNNTNAGTAKVTVTLLNESYTGTITKSFKIAKASQSLKVTTKAVNAKKAKNTTAKAIKKVSGAKGTVSYKKTSGSKKITVNAKTGKVTVKKGLKKGKTYKVKVKVSAKATSNYKAASKTVTIKVKVK